MSESVDVLRSSWRAISTAVNPSGVVARASSTAITLDVGGEVVVFIILYIGISILILGFIGGDVKCRLEIKLREI